MPEVINPYNQEVLATVEYDTKASIEKKIHKGRLQLAAGGFGTLAERVEKMTRFADALQSDCEQDARLLSQQTGKPFSQAVGEIKATNARLRYFIQTVPQLLWPRQTYFVETPYLEEKVTFEPLGVVANISAWNYPYFVGLNVIAPALLAGNVVAYKGSEWCPLTAKRIAEQLWHAGFSQEQMILITGDGQQGQELLDADIDGVFFTGSVPTGKAIAQKVSAKLIPVQLELGGKDSVYVTDSIDILSVAEQVADGAFYNTGQSCCSVERLYVHESIAALFIERLVQTVLSFTSGDPFSENTYLGPVTRVSQIEVLQNQVTDALEKGARILTGGAPDPVRPGFFQPTVITNANHTMSCMQAESFGPLIAVLTVKDDEEAVALMNDSDFGLTAAVYCEDKARAQRLLRHIKAGTVYVNACDRVSPFSPWSGRKNSGLGATLSHEGIRCFVVPKAWHMR